jgi:hypothetical protein
MLQIQFEVSHTLNCQSKGSEVTRGALRLHTKREREREREEYMVAVEMLLEKI